MMDVSKSWRARRRTLVLCAWSLASVAFACPALAQEDHSPAGNAFTCPPFHEPEDLPRLFHSSTKERVELLKAQAMRQAPSDMEREMIEKGLKAPVTVKGLESIATILDNWENQSMYWSILAALYCTDPSKEVKAFIKQEFNAAYAKIHKQWEEAEGKGDHSRQMTWTMIISTLEDFGHEDLLTDPFWAAAEAEGTFHDVLILHATAKGKERFAKYVESLKDEASRVVFEPYVEKIGIMLDFPELKAVNKRYLLPILHEVRMVPADERAQKVKEMLADAKERMKEDARQVATRASMQAATRPARNPANK
jgi:hypothetical protein